MFYVYVNKRKGRVLLTTRRLSSPLWKLAGIHAELRVAMRHARFIADIRDYILEWDLLAYSHNGIANNNRYSS